MRRVSVCILIGLTRRARWEKPNRHVSPHERFADESFESGAGRQAGHVEYKPGRRWRIICSTRRALLAKGTKTFLPTRRVQGLAFLYFQWTHAVNSTRRRYFTASAVYEDKDRRWRGVEGRRRRGEEKFDAWLLATVSRTGERERIEKLINEKNGVSRWGSLCQCFLFLIATDIDIVPFFFFLSSLFSSPVCPVLFADLLLSVFLLFRLCQVNIEI